MTKVKCYKCNAKFRCIGCGCMEEQQKQHTKELMAIRKNKIIFGNRKEKHILYLQKENKDLKELIKSLKN